MNSDLAPNVNIICANILDNCESDSDSSADSDIEHSIVVDTFKVPIASDDWFANSQILSVEPGSCKIQISRVAINKAPLMNFFINHQPSTALMDTGAESNVISDIRAKRLRLKISPTRSGANQVDRTKLKVLGSVYVTLNNKDDTFVYDALVCTDIGDIMICGNPLMSQGIIPNPVDNCIEVRSQLGPSRFLPWRSDQDRDRDKKVSASNTFLLRSPDTVTIFPGEFFEMDAPMEMVDKGDCDILVTPRITPNSKVTYFYSDANVCEQRQFPPPSLTSIIGGKIRIENPSLLPVTIPRNEHIADVKLLSVTAPSRIHQGVPSISCVQNQDKTSLLYPKPKPTIPQCQVDKVIVDPDNILSQDQLRSIRLILDEFKEAFSSKAGRYNGVLGNLNARVTLNNNLVEPPSHSPRRVIQSEKMDKIQQDIMDQMEADGILGRPEHYNVTVTHMHTSFILPKMEDGSPTGEWRLVTGMQSLSPYLKPTRLQLPTVEEAFRRIGKWQFLILTDLKHWHWQIPVQHQSMRFFGTSTPFGGDRVYLVQPMGYLNATENADRVIQRILQPVISEGKAARIADNMFTGGDTPEEAFSNFKTILALCSNAGITLKAQKTTICPVKINILGRVWQEGTMSPSTHIMSTISKATLPTTVKQLRGFNGSVKQMKDNLPEYYLLLQPLENATAGKKSADRIVWTSQLREQYKKVQEAAARPDILAMVRSGDKTIMFPDYSYDHQAGGAPLYVRREGKLLKVRNFGARLKTKKRWPPCEGEAWIIRVGVENHSPWIWDSGEKCEVATDNMPCVLSYRRLIRGDFSSSVRVAYYLSAIAQVPCYVVHKPGLNHPGDFDSRNPVPCDIPAGKCHVCNFAFQESGLSAQELLYQSQPPTVGAALTVADIDSGELTIPFTQSSGWKNIQEADPTLSKLKLHIGGGTIPVRRIRGSTELKRLYTLFQQGKVTLSKNGVVVYSLIDNVGNTKNLIIVPSAILKGLVTALHLKCKCPSRKELENIMARYWYSTSMAKTIQDVWEKCDTCQSLKSAPREIFEQSTTKSEFVGAQWAADVIKSDKQLIFIAREKLSNFTVTRFINDEGKSSIREAIILSTAELIPAGGLQVQVDNASALQALVSDAELTRYKIAIDLARKKNKNGNPVAEKAVQEFKQEKLKFKPEGGMLNELLRTLITASLNRRIRSNRISAREIITTRDQNTGAKLVVDDEDLAAEQVARRQANHPASAKSKVPGGTPAIPIEVWPGALVTVKKEKDKNKGRDKYLVIELDSTNPQMCKIKKMSKQLRQENYLVKTTEIDLCPNQVKPDPDLELSHEPEEDLQMDNPPPLPSFPAPSSVPSSARTNPHPSYNLRDKPTDKVTRKPATKLPPRFGWDTEEEVTTDDDLYEDQLGDQSGDWLDDLPTVQVEEPPVAADVRPPPPPDPPPYHPPCLGDVVQYYDGQVNKWLEVLIIKTTTRSLRRFPNYYNIRYREGDEGSAELSRDTLWCHSDPEKQEFYWWRWDHLYREVAEERQET